MSKSKIKKSVVFPLVMLAYLAVIAWIGRDRLDRGEYLYYFGIIGVGLVIILLLYFSLRKKEQLQQRREEEQQYGTYEEEEKEEKSKDKN
jgi:tetrahydromethanopterin S-methyltransferase subunit E